MPLVIGCISRKGGVGKSTLARALGVVVKSGGMSVLLADRDLPQSTSLEWAKLRDAHGLVPPIAARQFRTVEDALIGAGGADVLIIDAPEQAGAETVEIAREADLLVLPSGCGIDDLRPAVLLSHELMAANISRDRLVVMLCRSAGDAEEGAARRYLAKAGYHVATNSIPERLEYRESMNRGGSLIETADRNMNLRAQVAIDELLRLLRSVAAERVRRLRQEQAR